jgi:hypothetical protein
MGDHRSWPPLRGEMKTIPSRAAAETNATSPSPPFQTSVALVAAGRACLCPNGIHVAVAAERSARIDTSLCANRGVLLPGPFALMASARPHSGLRSPMGRMSAPSGRQSAPSCGVWRGTAAGHRAPTFDAALAPRHARRGRGATPTGYRLGFVVRALWSTICSNASASAVRFQDALDVIGRLLIRANR